MAQEVDGNARAEALKEFGRRLQGRLSAKGWNQSDLARSAQLGRDSISTYVNGKTLPTPLALKKMIDALGCSIDDLLPPVLISAKDRAPSAWELTHVATEPGKARLAINCLLPTELALKVIALIEEDLAHSN
jgi:transcriptional regulator with XRE-family HTH domain